jgi:stringent starvation protein B
MQSYHGGMTVLDDFASARPEDVIRRGNEWFVDAAAVPEVIVEATRRNVKVPT